MPLFVFMWCYKIEPSALHVLRNRSATELQPQLQINNLNEAMGGKCRQVGWGCALSVMCFVPGSSHFFSASWLQ